MNDKKPKFIENSKLFVKRIIERGTDEFGRDFIKTQWFEIEGELDFGSLKNPKNRDIIEIKYEIPDDKKSIFDRLFSG